MRTKKVNRYWCDFCNKAGLQAGAMRVHEKHCTLNADRACRVCILLEGSDGDSEDKKQLADLIAMLPDPTAWLECGGSDSWAKGQDLSDAIAACLPEFRKAAVDCPACMMAAIRLKKIPVPMVEGFNFTKEMKRIFEHANDAKHDDDFPY